MKENLQAERHMGFFGATGVGVGAIVGGGILALAGIAFSATGPSAILAFLINGFIAIITAMSFAELSTRFPQSGGTYTFAKKILSTEAAFILGWIVWFASIVAATLYALGFASYTLTGVDALYRIYANSSPEWITQQRTRIILATVAVFFYTVILSRKRTGGGQSETIGKLILFGILIIGGIFYLANNRSLPQIKEQMTPFFPHGASGLLQAMGFTFIALQGFDLIAAVAGEIRTPRKIIPKAMMLSLGIALIVYLPFLFIIITAGIDPTDSIVDISRQNPEIMIATAVEHYLGPFGFWLVIAAAILSMLSALQANLFAGSRMVYAMARDRALPISIGKLHPTWKTPVQGVFVSALTIIAMLLLLPDISSAGAASSLIFLIAFALTQWLCILVRIRGGISQDHFRMPMFPFLPILGIIACVSLALFQGIAVPKAGFITATWMVIGIGLFGFLFARRARVFDASMEAIDPQIIRLRGRSPLVLVPIVNPANAASLIALAHTFTPPLIGRVLLLSVVRTPSISEESQDALRNTQSVLQEAITASFSEGLAPEALITIAPKPLEEIIRVASHYHCESLFMGFSNLTKQFIDTHIEVLFRNIHCDVVILRALSQWKLEEMHHILVPVGGDGKHRRLRARLLSSLYQTNPQGITITFFRVLPESTSKETIKKTEKELFELAQDEVSGIPAVEIIQNNNPVQSVIDRANKSDFIILGLEQIDKRRRTIGKFSLKVIENVEPPVILICQND